jgi:hypothetical protein
VDHDDVQRGTRAASEGASKSMSNKAHKSDPPRFELEAPFVKELVSLGFDAFDDPAEITSTTAAAAKAIVEDQKSNRGDNNAKALLALLAVLVKMRQESRRTARVFKALLFGCGVIAITLYGLEKAGVIQFVHH